MSQKRERLEARGAFRAEEEALLAFLPTVLACEREYPIAEYRNHPGAKMEHSRIGLLNGKIVSHMRIYPRRIRLAQTEVVTGNIGGVCTDPAFRGRGYGAELLRDSIAYLRKRGVGMSIIHSGVTAFYASEGWETFPQRQYVFRGLPLHPVSGLTARRFERHRDLLGAARVHALYNEGRSLSVVRDRDYWLRHFSWIHEKEEGFYVVEAGNSIEGYVRSGDGTINEIAYNPKRPEVMDALMECVVRNGRKRGVEEFRLNCPQDAPFLNVLREGGQLREEVRWFMLCRMTDLAVLLKAVAPGLRRPKTVSCLEIRAKGESVILDFSTGKARIPKSGKAEVCMDLTQRDLFLWLCGESPLGISDPCGPWWGLLREIVPAGAPCFWMIDHV